MSIEGKKAAAKVAAQLVKSGMQLGLGTGSTSSYFITELGKRCRLEGLEIKAIATSLASQNQAKQEGISLINPDEITFLDLTIDGADEIDSQKRMIKGGGGALLREKIVATMSKEMIVIIDSSKEVDFLGKFPLALEIVPFGYLATFHHLKEKGYQPAVRKNQQGEKIISDNGNYLIDILLSYPCKDPEQEEISLKKIPGIVETGLFLHMAGRVIVGHPDGKTKTY